MGQVGAYHEERVPIYHRADDCRDLLRSGVADKERDQSKASEDRLEEEQLDLERMLRGVRPVVDADDAGIDQRGDRLHIHGDFSERRGETACRRRRNPAHRHVMRWADQEHAREAMPGGSNFGKGACRDGPRVHVAGMGAITPRSSPLPKGLASPSRVSTIIWSSPVPRG